ncbi:MAG: hypothetical protein LQ351_006515 [Letrouitia transgressa]|nr:MAG: hypothetical protein LQ351_006515 [Letrouitia transgressa]
MPPLRLLDAQTFCASLRSLKKRDLFATRFNPRSEPSYAILSHRWCEGVQHQDITSNKISRSSHHHGKIHAVQKRPRKRAREVTLQDLQRQSLGHLRRNAALRASLAKIQGCCARALAAGQRYVWIDSCCIDRTNLFEVSESIRSMFRWYRDAACCFAYLWDVDGNGDAGPPLRRKKSEGQEEYSEWFSRGWTLQELLAPQNLLFFDRRWNELGNRRTLAAEVQSATGIPVKYVTDFANHAHEASVAMKMSWMARRRTTKAEDTAYCLFGIMGVSMDVRYGDGRKEFLRFQDKIMREPGLQDESIFAWRSIYPLGYPEGSKHSGLLAAWPDAFEHSGSVRLRPEKYRSRGPYGLTKDGLRLPVPLSIAGGAGYGNFLGRIKALRNALFGTTRSLPLQCWMETLEGWRTISLTIRKVNGNWQRVQNDCFEQRTWVKWMTWGKSGFRELYFPQKRVE